MQFIKEDYREPLLMKWQNNAKMECMRGIIKIAQPWDYKHTKEHGKDNIISTVVGAELISKIK